MAGDPQAGQRWSVDQLRRLPLDQLATWVATCPPAELPAVAAALAGDARRGAQALAARARRRWEWLRQERRRFRRRFRYERQLWRQGFRYLAGVDEVGRGPLAGPVVAAAVILDRRAWIPGLDDSKALSPAARERLAQEIRRQCVAIAVGLATVSEINRLNIHHAAQLAMRRAVEALDPRPDHLLVDGFPLSGTEIPQWAVVGGDRASNSIASAAVVAKVYRDRLMEELDRRFPGYGFARHKGYPTAEHRAALRRLGPSPVHRAHFRLL